jgi:hypothetical protein
MRKKATPKQRGPSFALTFASPTRQSSTLATKNMTLQSNAQPLPPQIAPIPQLQAFSRAIVLANQFSLIDSRFRSIGGQQKGLFVGGDGAAGDVCGRMFLERRIGVSTSPWSHQGQLVMSVSSLSVWRFFKLVCTSCLFIYSSPVQEDGGLRV